MDSTEVATKDGPGRGRIGGRRYTNLSFPPYHYLPGLTPHPKRHPEGHLHGKLEASVAGFDPAAWFRTGDYLYGVDLYNHGYYWEAHEAWEGLWKTTRRKDLPGLFLQGLIQVSGALLKRELRAWRGMEKLSGAGLGKLRAVAQDHPVYCGLDLARFIAVMGTIVGVRDSSTWPGDPRIQLDFPSHSTRRLLDEC